MCCVCHFSGEVCEHFSESLMQTLPGRRSVRGIATRRPARKLLLEQVTLLTVSVSSRSSSVFRNEFFFHRHDVIFPRKCLLQKVVSTIL